MALTNKNLLIDVEHLPVLGVLVEKRSDDRFSGARVLPEQGVPHGQVRVALPQSCADAGADVLVEEVGLAAFGVDVGVGSEKR